MKNLPELILKYVEQSGASSKPNLFEALKAVKQRIELAEKIETTMTTLFAEVKMGAFITCPNCKSNTLLEFSACHLCGFQLLDSVAPENVTTPIEQAISEVTKPTSTRGASVTKVVVDEPEEIDEETVVQATTKKIGEIEKGLEEASKKRGRKPKDKTEEKVEVKEPKKRGRKSKVEEDVELGDDDDLIQETETKKPAVILPTKEEIMELDQQQLQKLNVLLKLNIDLKGLKKLGQFREAVVEAVKKLAEPKKEEEKPSKKTSDKEKAKEVEVKKEVAQPKKSPKIVEVTEEDFMDEEEDLFSDDGEEDILETITPESDEEAIENEMKSLKEEDFDLDGFDVDDIDFDEE